MQNQLIHSRCALECSGVFVSAELELNLFIAVFRALSCYICMCSLRHAVRRFSEASAYFHEEEKEGLVRICKLALHKKFPKYASDGYEVLYVRPPVIYLSAAAKANLAQFLCHQVPTSETHLPLCFCIANVTLIYNLKKTSLKLSCSVECWWNT